MRLREDQVEAIISAVEAFLPQNAKAQLLLYGSRVDDNLKGGDIDLALVITDEVERIKMNDYKIVAKIKSKKAIGDRRIDFKVLGAAEAQSGFFSEALKKSTMLKEW